MSRKHPEPNFETLEEEVSLAIDRHVELMNKYPGLTVSSLFQLVDHYRIKHNIGIDEISNEGGGLWLIYMAERERVAALGVDSPENLERATEKAQMLPEHLKRRP